MEKMILSQTDQYFTTFKTEIQKKAIELSFEEKDKMNELLNFIFEFEKIKYVFPKKGKMSESLNTDTIINIEETKLGQNIQTPHTPQTPQAPQIMEQDQCIALRKQGMRCSRKKTKGQQYCGTHCMKGGSLKNNETTPNENSKMPPPSLQNENTHSTQPPLSKKTSKTMEVVAHEIQGIIYYIDKEMNVYNTEDIFKNINNPRVIAKAVQLGQNLFSIPSLGL
jgi:hypothetical protein